MQPFANDVLSLLLDLHSAIEQAIDGLPQDALDWSPGPDTNSIAVLAVHIAGAERYLLGDVVARDPSHRDRPAEFQTRGVDAATLKRRLDAASEYARHALGSLTLEDLETNRVSPRDGREHSVAWWITHAIDHTALHLGHIEMMRHWWEHRQAQ